MTEPQINNISVVEMAEIVSQSGCPHIQDAIAAIEEHGFSVADLDSASLESVVQTIASAESVGAEAGRVGQ